MRRSYLRGSPPRPDSSAGSRRGPSAAPSRIPVTLRAPRYPAEGGQGAPPVCVLVDADELSGAGPVFPLAGPAFPPSVALPWVGSDALSRAAPLNAGSDAGADAAKCRALRGHAAALHDIAHAVTVIPDTIAANDVARARLAIDQLCSSSAVCDEAPAPVATRLLTIAITLDDAVYMSGVNGGGRTVAELRAALKRVIEGCAAMGDARSASLHINPRIP